MLKNHLHHNIVVNKVISTDDVTISSIATLCQETRVNELSMGLIQSCHFG